MRAKEYPMAKPGTASEEHIALISKYTPKNAKQTLLKEAAQTQILIINEAHHIGMHRAFVCSMLKELKQLGYTHLGLEGLSHNDSLLTQRGYPILSSGYYTMEPNFGNLIREALALGFKVFAYEQKFEDATQMNLNREVAQAQNVMEVIKENPNGKFLLYCGYDHVIEDTLRNFMGLPMAGRVKQLSAIDPFTVDQSSLTEYAVFGNRYRLAMNFSEDCILVDSNGNYFNKASLPKKVDCQLYHPNTQYINGRAHWLLRENIRLIPIQAQINLSYPCLVKVYLKTDTDSLAVPIDVVEIADANDEKYILVYKQKAHKVVVKNALGRTQTIYLKEEN